MFDFFVFASERTEHKQETEEALFCVVLKTMERYEIVKDIGSGNFGVAKLVRDKSSKELFAVKFIERGQKVCYVCIPP